MFAAYEATVETVSLACKSLPWVSNPVIARMKGKSSRTESGIRWGG